MKKNPLEQAFRQSRAIKKYADGALVTAQTGQTDPITNVGTGSSGLGELIWEPIRDVFQTAYTAPEVNTGVTEEPVVTPTVTPKRPYHPREYASYEDPENYSPIGYVNPSGRQFYEYEPITYTGPAPTDLTRFQTAFDPNTGRMFYSPAEAIAYGVNDYVLSTPTGLPRPASLADLTDEELARKAALFGISPDAYMNYSRQIEAAKPEQEFWETRLSTQNDNMPIGDLVAKLQYYDANPPKNFQELQEQRVLWADYNNRYATSGGTYEDLGGVGQNWELQPERNFYAPTVTGYANSLDQLLNEYAQTDRTMQNYYDARKLVTQNPSLDRIFQNVESIMGKKPFEGTDANFINAEVRNLQGELDRIGPYAERNFYQRMANEHKVANLPWNAPENADPTYRELMRAADALTPVVNDDLWNKRAENSRSIYWRDPVTGKGFGYEPDANGQSGVIRAFDTDGSWGRAVSTNSAPDVIKLLDDANIRPEALKTFNENLKQSSGVDLSQKGLDVNGITDKTKLQEVASDKYVQDAMKHYDWQEGVAKRAGFSGPGEGARQQFEKDLLSQQAAAKALLGQPTTTPAAKNGGAVMMKRGGPVNLEKEFRLADMIDMKGVGSAKKSDEPVQKFAGAGLVKKAIQAGKKMSKAESEAAGLYHPIGGGLKLPKPVSEYKFETIQDPRFSPEVRRLLSPEDFLGKVGIPLLGDRAAAGKLLTELEGRKLNEIIALEGGPEFMMNHPYLWASDKAVINKLAKQARKAAESGKDVLGVNIIGSPTNVDFNKMVSGVLFDNLDTSSLRKKDIKAFDAEMRKSFPEFLGLEHPEVKEQMFGPNMGTKRTEFVKIMNKDKYQSSGFPDVTAARIAVTEPRLIDMPTGSAGFTVGKFDPENPVIENPEIPHETYPVKTGGEYVGGLEAPLDFKDIFTDFSEARRMLGADPARDLRSLSFQSPAIQEFDQEWLDKVMPTYEEILKSKRYAKGGDVELDKEFKGKSRLIPKAVIDALNTKRKLSPAEAKIAGQYAKPENQWDVGSILEEIDPVYTVGRGAETLKNVDYGAIKDLLLQRYQLEKDPRKALEKELGQIGEAMFGALDVAPAGALATKPARTAIKSLAQKFESVPVGLSIEDVTPKSVNFVSSVEKAIKGHKMESMNGEQWANWMRANASKSAKKEAEATGLYDWLKSQGKVSKADIEAYVEGNLPQITRIEKGAPLKLTSKDEIRLSELHRRNTFKDQEPLTYDEYNELMRLENIRDKRTPEDLMRQSQMFEESAKKAQAKGDKEAAESLFKRSEHMAQRAEALELNPLEVGGSKFEKWKEPGGEKYRETLLVLPENRRINKAAYDFAEAKGISKEEMDTNPDVREAVFAEMGKTTPVYEPSTAFRSKHWDEPNVLMHIRSNERLTPEGKRALFLEELQSDWAQKARKTGVKQDVTDDMLREYHESVRKDTDPTWEDLPSKDKAFLRHIVENRQIDAVPSAPYISDTGDWTKLGLKQALKDAIEGGHDYLAWTTGEQQAKRYDLSKQVSEIAYHPKGKALEVFDIEGNNIINEEGINPEDLADYIGKEAAEKVLNSTEIDRGYNILKGDNIRVGGEGMKAYYDRMVPQYMNDILKQYGIKDGVKPVDISYIQTKGIPKNLSADDLLSQYGRELAPDQRQYLERYLDRWDLESEMGGTEDLIGEYKNWLDLQDFSPKPIKTGTHLGIEITPELREKILNEGLPHFNEGGTVNNGLKRLVSRFESEYAVPFPRDN